MCNVRQKSQYRSMQYAAAISAALSSASTSVYYVWTSPMLPLLQSEDTPLERPITDDEASWLVSSILLASCIGIVIGGWLTESIGRKLPLMIASVLQLIPWIIIIFAKHIYVLLLARSIGGIGSGIAAVASSIYNAEIADRDNRGKLGAVLICFKLTGSLVVLTIGPYVSYTALAIICASFPVACFSAFLFMPESPHYMAKINDIYGMKRSIRRLTASNVHEKDIEKISQELRSSVETEMANNTTVWEFLSNKQYRRSIIIMAGIKILHQFSGHIAIEAYLQPIIAQTDSIVSPEQSSVLCAIAQVVGVLAASLLVDKLGRKPLLVISALGCGLALCGEGAYFYIQDVTANSTDGIKWLPTTGIAIFMVMSAIGIVSVPFVLLGELFSTNIKGIAVSITAIYGAMLGFAVSKSFDPISRALGLHSMFWLFAGNCILGAIFVVLLLPETKGETFADIQDKVNGRGQKGVYYVVV